MSIRFDSAKRNGWPRLSASLCLVVATILMAGREVQAQMRNQHAMETECRLDHLRQTDSAVARSYIEKACNFLSLSTSAGLLAQQERDFHGCILDVVPGTDDDRNAVQLANACKSRVWSR